MNFLIDMGNSFLKWGMTNNGELVSGRPIGNIDINHSSLVRLWQDVIFPDQIAISCVTDSRLSSLVQSVANELWPDVAIKKAKSEAEQLGVHNAYQEPEKLGVDRWLCLLAGYQLYRKTLCIVDCGTAITLDVVDASGQHLGGLISPGLRLMKEALAKGTENLKLSETHYPFGLANFTDAAIHNGTISAACGLIEMVLKNQPETTQLLLTGGDAEIIAAHVSRPAIIDPDLVLRGLALTLQKGQ